MRSAGSAARCLPRYRLRQLQEAGLIIFRKGLARSYPSLLPLALDFLRRASGKQCGEKSGFLGIFSAICMSHLAAACTIQAETWGCRTVVVWRAEQDVKKESAVLKRK